jgi:hypothetical protein
MRRAAALAVIVLLAASCGGTDEPGDGGTDPPSVLLVEVYDADQKPGVRLTYEDQRIEVIAYTYCWSGDGAGVCADGIPSWPEEFVEVPSGTQVEVAGIHDSIEDFTLVPPFDDGEGPDHEADVAIELTEDAGVVEADPGEYGLSIFAYLPQGDGAFMAGIRVTDGQAG